MICTNSDRQGRVGSSRPGPGLWAGAALAVLALPLALGLAGTPLSGELSQKIEAAAEQAGASVDLSRATETFEDPSVLFIPAAEGAHRYVLYDTKTGRAVLVEYLGPEGFAFHVADPQQPGTAAEFQLGADGYFGPPEVLSALGQNDASLATAQGGTCAAPCFEHANLPACGTCTAASLLLAMRSEDGAPPSDPNQSGSSPPPPLYEPTPEADPNQPALPEPEPFDPNGPSPPPPLYEPTPVPDPNQPVVEVPPLQGPPAPAQPPPLYEPTPLPQDANEPPEPPQPSPPPDPVPTQVPSPQPVPTPLDSNDPQPGAQP